MSIRKHDIVVLTDDLPSERLTAGDVGTVVHIHEGGAAYEVEFATLLGRTVAIATARAHQLRETTPQDLVHVRQLQSA